MARPNRQSYQLLAEARDKYKHSPLSQEAIRERYPRLIRALKFVLIGSDGEAACVISCYRQGIDYGGEACSHSGLTTADRMVDATSYLTRKHVRQSYARMEEQSVRPQP